MGTTTNYGYNVPVGSDNVNLLPQMAANFPMIDSDLKAVSNAAVGTATELLTGTVHALTRSDTARNVFHFTATANYEAGETFEVDGVQVTAKTPDGQNLSTGAYVINSSVLCILDGTLLTVIVNPAKALDADKLDGHDSSYFATAGDLSTLDNQVGAISSKVGTGVLDVGSNCVDGINTLNTHLSDSEELVSFAAMPGINNRTQHCILNKNTRILTPCLTFSNTGSSRYASHILPNGITGLQTFAVCVNEDTKAIYFGAHEYVDGQYRLRWTEQLPIGNYSMIAPFYVSLAE